MSHSRKLILPAIVALGLFAVTPAVVGLQSAMAGKNGDTVTVSGGKNGDTGGTGATNKNGGGGATDKNGGGGATDKNGGGGNTGPQGPAGPQGPQGPAGPSGGGQINIGGGGGGYDFGYSGSAIRCVVNGQVFQVRSVSECRYGEGFAYHGRSYFGGGYAYGGEYAPTPRPRIARPVRGYSFGGGYAYGGGAGMEAKGGGDMSYGYPAPRVKYVGRISRAARMQIERRQFEGYESLNDGGYGAGYDMQLQGGYNMGGYGMQVQGGGYGYGMEQGGGYYGHRKMRHHRRHHGYAYGNGAGCNCGSFDQGYTVHYGPTMDKNGGY